MSSPWNGQENWNAAAPTHGSGGVATGGRAVATDEWDLLRSSPDYDQDEMQGVSLPASYAAPVLSPTPSAPPASWSPATPPVAPPAPEWTAPLPVTSPEASGSPALLSPRERWPEAADVAHLAGDLFADAQGDGLWRPMDEGSAPFHIAADRTTDDSLDWTAILARAEDLAVDAADGMPSESWAFLPDAMLQGGDEGVDLLDQALAAGAKAGLMDAGTRLEVTEPPSGSRPRPAAEGELPDLLDAALTAGERAGLMGR